LGGFFYIPCKKVHWGRFLMYFFNTGFVSLLLNM